MSNFFSSCVHSKYDMGLRVLVCSSIIINFSPSLMHSHCVTHNQAEMKILYGDFLELLKKLDAKKETDDVNGTVEILFELKAEMERMVGQPISMKKYLKKLSKEINRDGKCMTKEVMSEFSSKILFIDRQIRKGIASPYYSDHNPNWKNSPYTQENKYHPKIEIGITIALAGLFLVCLPISLPLVSATAIGTSLIITGTTMAGHEILDEFCDENWEPRKKD